MRAFRFLFLSCLLILPATSCNAQDDRDIFAAFVRQVYWDAMKGTAKMDVSRSYEITDSISRWTDVFNLPLDRNRGRHDWESGFVNNIRDRNLPLKSWSYGYSGIQVETAQRSADRLGLGIRITGRMLIMDFDLNIMLGCEQMRFLLDHRTNGDQRIAESSYNAGYNGYKQGRGLDYPKDIDAMVKKWRKFKELEHGK